LESQQQSATVFKRIQWPQAPDSPSYAPGANAAIGKPLTAGPLLQEEAVRPFSHAGETCSVL